jgi:hypothetical protein
MRIRGANDTLVVAMPGKIPTICKNFPIRAQHEDGLQALILENLVDSNYFAIDFLIQTASFLQVCGIPVGFVTTW